ncbi:hypothetical protein BH23BAC4_BH23BAC4_06290 [soil metagenome]
MDKDEFERIKQEEKDHLRKLRALKQQHSDVQRRVRIAGAVNSMRDPELDRTHDEFVRKLDEGSALQEARFEIAMESAGLDKMPDVSDPEVAEEIRKAEAAAIVEQMRRELGEAPAVKGPGDAPATPSDSDKTIGPSRASSGSSDAEIPAKSIGRAGPPPQD